MIAMLTSNNTVAAIVALVVVLLGLWYIWIMQQRLTVEMQKLKLQVQVQSATPPHPVAATSVGAASAGASTTTLPQPKQSAEAAPPPPGEIETTAAHQSDEQNADGWHRSRDNETGVFLVTVPDMNGEGVDSLFKPDDDIIMDEGISEEISEVSDDAEDDADYVDDADAADNADDVDAADAEDAEDAEDADSTSQADHEIEAVDGDNVVLDDINAAEELGTSATAPTDAAAANTETRAIPEEFDKFSTQEELYLYLKNSTVQELKRICARNSVSVTNPGGAKKLKSELISGLVETYDHANKQPTAGNAQSAPSEENSE